MKACELISKLRAVADPTAVEAATMLERYLVLADELWIEANGKGPHQTVVGLIAAQTKIAVAKRLREIAENEG